MNNITTEWRLLPHIPALANELHNAFAAILPAGKRLIRANESIITPTINNLLLHTIIIVTFSFQEDDFPNVAFERLI